MKRLMLCLALLVGCSKPAPPALQPAPQPQPGFTTSEPSLKQDPTFVVTFSAPLSQGRSIKITARSMPWLRQYDLGDEVEFEDEVRQADGKWVVFDCDAIADRIIDLDLVKELRSYCKIGHEMAKDYWKKRDYSPDEFVDSTGQKWIKAK